MDFLLILANGRSHEFLSELSLAIYATVWGFRRVPIVNAYDSELPVRKTHEVAPAY